MKHQGLLKPLCACVTYWVANFNVALKRSRILRPERPKGTKDEIMVRFMEVKIKKQNLHFWGWVSRELRSSWEEVANLVPSARYSALPPTLKASFGSHFSRLRMLSHILGFHQKIKILPISLHLLLGIGDPPPSPTSQIPKTPIFFSGMNKIK